jgi:hypothetical protein
MCVPVVELPKVYITTVHGCGSLLPAIKRLLKATSPLTHFPPFDSKAVANPVMSGFPLLLKSSMLSCGCPESVPKIQFQAPDARKVGRKNMMWTLARPSIENYSSVTSCLRSPPLQTINPLHTERVLLHHISYTLHTKNGIISSHVQVQKGSTRLMMWTRPRLDTETSSRPDYVSVLLFSWIQNPSNLSEYSSSYLPHHSPKRKQDKYMSIPPPFLETTHRLQYVQKGSIRTKCALLSSLASKSAHGCWMAFRLRLLSSS